MTPPPTPMFDSSPKPNTSTEPVNVAELVERLGYHREHPVTGKLELTNPDGPAAAFALVSLQARAEAAEASLAAAQTNFFTMQGAANELRIRAEAAEAERDRMREALSVVAETKVTLNQVETGEVFNGFGSRALRTARTRLFRTAMNRFVSPAFPLPILFDSAITKGGKVCDLQGRSLAAGAIFSAPSFYSMNWLFTRVSRPAKELFGARAGNDNNEKKG